MGNGESSVFESWGLKVESKSMTNLTRVGKCDGERGGKGADKWMNE